MNLSDDRVVKFLDSCYEAGIKRPELFLISKMPQVYNWLKGCFPRGILPTDIDGEVELNGHFLRMEFKHERALRNGAIPRGQMMALSRVVQLRAPSAETKVFTVLLIGTSNETGEPSCCDIWYPGGKKQGVENCDVKRIREICKRWSAYAEKSNVL